MLHFSLIAHVSVETWWRSYSENGAALGHIGYCLLSMLVDFYFIFLGVGTLPNVMTGMHAWIKIYPSAPCLVVWIILYFLSLGVRVLLAKDGPGRINPFDQNLGKLKQICGGERIYLNSLHD